jgi:hypothetical protein
MEINLPRPEEAPRFCEERKEWVHNQRNPLCQSECNWRGPIATSEDASVLRSVDFSKLFWTPVKYVRDAEKVPVPVLDDQVTW